MTNIPLPGTGSPATADPQLQPLEHQILLRHHQLGRLTPGWWRPLPTLLLAVVAAVGLLLAGLVAVMVAGAVDPGVGRAVDRALAPEELVTTDPVALAVMLAMLAVLVPACRWAVRVTGRRGTLDSVEGRFRWGLFWRATLPALLVLAISIALSLLFSPTPVRLVPQAGALALVVLLGVPLQAAGEEYFFRGLLPQVLGSWLRSPLWGVLASLPLFVAGHDYNALGLVGVGSFAAAASWLVWRTGGLEVVIAWHVVNNLIAFGLQVLGLADPDAAVTWPAAVADLVSTAALLLLVELAWRRSWSHRYRATAVAR